MAEYGFGVRNRAVLFDNVCARSIARTRSRGWRWLQETATGDNLPVDSFASILRWLDGVVSAGVIEDYAITGAVAASIWDEATATQDLDVAVIVAQGGHSALDPLRPVLAWLDEQGYQFEGEHVVVSGVPVQLLPAWHPLIEDAIRAAVDIPYRGDGIEPGARMRLVAPTYLVASWRLPGAQSARRAERAQRLRDAGVVDEALLAELMARYGL